MFARFSAAHFQVVKGVARPHGAAIRASFRASLHTSATFRNPSQMVASMPASPATQTCGLPGQPTRNQGFTVFTCNTSSWNIGIGLPHRFTSRPSVANATFLPGTQLGPRRSLGLSEHQSSRGRESTVMEAGGCWGRREGGREGGGGRQNKALEA